MRSFLIAAVAVCFGQFAQAADLPFLRGSFQDGPIAPRAMWEGFYIGGQAGYGSGDTKFIRFQFRPDSVPRRQYCWIASGDRRRVMAAELQQSIGRSEVYGGFAGYNSQWEDVVIGVEMSYMHGKFGGDDPQAHDPLQSAVGQQLS